MELKRYSVADDFLDDNHLFLFAQEAANNLIIGMAARWSARKEQTDALKKAGGQVLHYYILEAGMLAQ